MMVIAYTYKADLLCPNCVAKIAKQYVGEGGKAEDLLNRWAAKLGVDRQDEYSYDSWDFPKVVFYTTCMPCENGEEHEECRPETCGGCLKEIE